MYAVGIDLNNYYKFVDEYEYYDDNYDIYGNENAFRVIGAFENEEEAHNALYSLCDKAKSEYSMIKDRRRPCITISLHDIFGGIFSFDITDIDKFEEYITFNHGYCVRFMFQNHIHYSIAKQYSYDSEDKKDE